MPSVAHSTGPHAAIGTWREGVQRAMLTIAAIVGPAIVVATIVLRAGAWTALDQVMLVAVGVVVPLCRLVPGPLATRAVVMLSAAFATSFYFLGRNGLAGGISAALLTMTILASLSTNRSLGIAFVIATLLAYVTTGLLARGHHVTINHAATDPTLLRNWIRIGSVNAVLAGLLIAVVEFVVRRVEANSQAATEALRWLRTAYDRLETTKEDERRFLAHELHDELGQTLTALKLSLQVAARGAPDTQGRALAQPLGIVEDLIARVRRISLDLRPPLLDEVGLVSALRAYLAHQASVSGLTIELHATEPSFRLPNDYEIACFRVVQESITNVLRHARAQRIDVRLVQSANGVSLSIEDDGRGFDPAALDAAAAQGHLGVRGMRERTRARGGKFRLTSTPAGTIVRVELDVPPAPPGP